MSSTYQEPLSLIVISSISIGLGALAAGWILTDIVLRRGWRSMMAVMIPVYVINALYLWPITLWVYLRYGRPSDPNDPKAGSSHCHDHGSHQTHDHSDNEGTGSQHSLHFGQTGSGDQHGNPQQHHTSLTQHEAGENGHKHHLRNSLDQQQSIEPPGQDVQTDLETGEKSAEDSPHQQHHRHNSDSTRPFFATVTVGVCHCGAGCVLGDIVGEWLVYGTNATLGSNPPRLLWTEMLVDFAFAFLFGVVFQYFSIAPMAGDYSYRSLVRALKADALSLLAFEIGLFGWMVAFQIGIFQDQLEMNTVTYWWMMQIGMFVGHWTGVPVNWWLIKAGIKEPCV